ncbi:UMP kinase [Microbaculum marinum]|uniref:Uridylate kinase n=1 Tax=Microbaculum marinum TaxID=1764581 RepID=A0AAW9S0D9_9HYPH
MPASPAYKRVLLKVSGEALMGEGTFGVDMGVLDRIAGEVAAAARSGVEMAIVVGGGNIFRGVAGAARGMDRATADGMGMLATVMNAVALASAIEQAGAPARALSAIAMEAICGTLTRQRGLDLLAAGTVVVCAAGTGNPFFTTDTAAALRAAELGCDVILKGTQVDGVYDADPKVYPDARRFETLTFADALVRDLKIMDTAAFALARDNDIPIVVFDIHNPGALADVLTGAGRATLVSG